MHAMAIPIPSMLIVDMIRDMYALISNGLISVCAFIAKGLINVWSYRRVFAC